IGAALYGVLAWATTVLQIPGAGNVSVRPAVAIPMFFGVVFGPIVGFITGFLGNIIADLLAGGAGGFWFWWHLGNGLLGFFTGLIFMTIVNYRDIGSIIRAEIMVVVGIIVGMGIASLSDMWVSGMDFRSIVTVDFVPAFITDIIWGLVLVPILMVAYSAVQARSGR
ncbi:MAG TPA: ECF transporter S component, partial [Anaerolineales bacterium]|nr:ECF transporter S component [Anaerolineales bacterium]